MKNKRSAIEPEAVRQHVREGYGKIATRNNPRRSTSCGCCGPKAINTDRLVQHIGYSAEDLTALPEGANMGLSCGNPTAMASLKPGETVLDLGSGGGFDVFIAGQKLGATGRAIGVDMTPEMLAKARRNIAGYRKRTQLSNVEFRLGEIEHLPVADSSVDAIISNCVINLSPDKPQVWREMARVLKPGGRVAVSDLALIQPLPAAVTEMIEALVGCIAGAVLVTETERMAREAGLADITLTPKNNYINAMTDWKDPLYRKILKHLPKGSKPSDYITSLEVQARKPAGRACGASRVTPAVTELVAIGAAIAANCEPCFKHHYNQARKLGVSVQDMSAAVKTAASVKQAPAQAVLALADRFLRGDFTATTDSACCPGTPPPAHPRRGCCQ